MNRSFWIFPLCSGFVLALLTSGCTPSNKVAPGAPRLLGFSVVDPSGGEIDLTPSDAGDTPTIPPLATFVALFDRLLDPTTLERVDPDAGTITQLSNAALVESSAVTGPVPATTRYIPNGDSFFPVIIYPKGPTVTILPTQGLPSGSPVSVTLEPSLIRSHDQTTSFVAPDGGATMFTFETGPLAVTVSVPAPEPPDGGSDEDADVPDGGSMSTWVTPPVASDFVVAIQFNNWTDKTATHDAIGVTATVAGAPVNPLNALVESDDATPGAWVVKPPDGGWPKGATVTVTVAATATDAFHKPLPAASPPAVFKVKP